ncbi:MAG: signal recognition particle-docking protein FtsY [Myxococcota bacterium]
MNTENLFVIAIVVVALLVAYFVFSGRTKGDRAGDGDATSPRKEAAKGPGQATRDASVADEVEPGLEPTSVRTRPRAPDEEDVAALADDAEDARGDTTPALSDATDDSSTTAGDEGDGDDTAAAAVDGEAARPAPPPPPVSRRKKDVKGLRRGLKKVRGESGFFGRLKQLFRGRSALDPELVDELEEILLTSDVGTKTTEMLLQDIRAGLANDELNDPQRAWDLLRERARTLLDIDGDGPIRHYGTPTVVLLVGVNGTGKTTTIGKLATQFARDEKKVLLVAGDTFRAAAVQQLQAWGQRVGCDVFAGEDDADPASVVFDAIKKGQEDEVDLILVDTAGRLHTKSNLMDELKKVVKVCGKALDGAPHETLLVVDGTTGQNALQQAREFGEALSLSGLVLTKLDGTAKGGVVLAIAHEQRLAVRYIGVGERRQDLRDFHPDEFVEAMLGTAPDAPASTPPRA